MQNLKAAHEALSHTDWLRQKLARSTADTRPRVSHEQIMSEAQAIIDRKRHSSSTWPPWCMSADNGPMAANFIFSRGWAKIAMVGKTARRMTILFIGCLKPREDSHAPLESN